MKYSLSIIACISIIGFYAWTARPSARQMYDINDPARAYYNQLVDGFSNGRLDLKISPPPGLSKLSDPYDPGLNFAYQYNNHLHDISFYKGKFYLYFGITPALILFWPYAALTGHYLAHKQAVAIFSIAGFFISVILLRLVRRRYFSRVGEGVMAACTLALGLATTMPLMLQRPEIWEVAISCAYALAMLALTGIWLGLHDTVRRYRWLAAASFTYGLAIGARPNLSIGAVVFLLPVLQAWREEGRGRRFQAAGRAFAAVFVPMLFIGSGLMIYNYLRFDNPLEFGQHYPLSGSGRENQMHALFGAEYFWFNFRVYFIQPMHWTRHFPFVEGIKVPTVPDGELVVEDPLSILP